MSLFSVRSTLPLLVCISPRALYEAGPGDLSVIGLNLRSFEIKGVWTFRLDLDEKAVRYSSGLYLAGPGIVMSSSLESSKSSRMLAGVRCRGFWTLVSLPRQDALDPEIIRD
jgi:hypothetical protein